MQPGPRSSRGNSTRHSRRPSSTGGTDRPLGVTIICGLGILGILVSFLPIFQLLGIGGVAATIALFLFGLNIAHLVVIIGLLNMSATALTWAYVFYGIGLLFDLIMFNLIGVLVSGIILFYLASVSHKFT
ncbi:hypothetical protein G6M89_07085 [Natronolimnobius sp. AArcel1]|uniref:hypothetical protein n=1 Tax=Natronolimnobius sp. AArcel1 TaxID=1679093 RepID=UPI0013ED898F|nr:hypothetical protein [Natronolimnobius sp. AArcel1]NGM68774.1 hypothetical protein [Natronolimnobius sp. AArcel1]